MTARPRRPLSAYLQPHTLVMLMLGFSSGLPFLLTGNTLGYWLRDEGTTLTAIGFLSWVQVVYSLKFLWAPLVDRVSPPILGRLGRRRGWMLAAQIVAGLGLAAMSTWSTARGLAALGVVALAVAFASATQDIVIDAWRIESAADEEDLGLLSSAYQFGYRMALLATDALILIAAADFGWHISYAACAAAMSLGIAATLFAAEPLSAGSGGTRPGARASWRNVIDAIAGPVVMFFRTHGWLALLMLAAIALYRLPDFMMGPMANPFYHDIGLSKTYVGSVRGTIGLVASLAGIAAGGGFAARFGTIRALIAGGILQATAIAAFALLAVRDPDTLRFAIVMTGDNFSTSFAGVALVTYMSGLTSRGYTATQYALLSSAYAWSGKLLKGFSGAIVDALKPAYGALGAYEIFFIGAGLIGIPAIVLLLALEVLHSGTRPAPAADTAT